MVTGCQDPRRLSVLGLLLCVLSPSVAHASKLLLVPIDGSHWLSMLGLIQQLQQRGHEIVVLAPDASVFIKEGASYTLRKYPVPFQRKEVEESFIALGRNVFENAPFLQRVVTTYKKVRKDSALLLSGCSHLLHNKDVMASLAEAGFDAVLTDPFLPCGSIVARYLALPAVYFLNALPCSMDSKATQCPSPLSYVPRIMTVSSDHMSFLQRVKNALVALMENFLCDVVYSPYASLASEVLQRDMSVQELMSSASVWLLRGDFVKDYPRPIMPNMVFVGGINCLHRNPLSPVCM